MRANCAPQSDPSQLSFPLPCPLLPCPAKPGATTEDVPNARPQMVWAQRVGFALMRQCVTGSDGVRVHPPAPSRASSTSSKLVKFISIIIHGIDFISCRIVIACLFAAEICSSLFPLAICRQTTPQSTRQSPRGAT